MSILNMYKARAIASRDVGELIGLLSLIKISKISVTIYKMVDDFSIQFNEFDRHTRARTFKSTDTLYIY